MKTISYLQLTKEQLQEIYNKYPHLKQKTINCLLENADYWTKDKMNELKSIVKSYSCGYFNNSEYKLENFNNFVPAILEYIATYSMSETLTTEFAELELLSNEFDEDTNEDEIFIAKCMKFFAKFWETEILMEYKWIENLTDDQLFVEFYEHTDDILDAHFYIDGILLQEAHA